MFIFYITSQIVQWNLNALEEPYSTVALFESPAGEYLKVWVMISLYG